VAADKEMAKLQSAGSGKVHCTLFLSTTTITYQSINQSICQLFNKKEQTAGKYGASIAKCGEYPTR
jgi:hypothetical protein